MIHPQFDIALLRFLRARTDERSILNAPPPAHSVPAGGPQRDRTSNAELATRILCAARELALGGPNGVPYGQLARSDRFAAYRVLTWELWRFDPSSLIGRNERTAFWINLHNALVIDAVINFWLRESVREVPGFFHRAAYQIGGYRFALADIEHGVLRGNRPLHPRLPSPFLAGDPRAALALDIVDPRIHFALNCGTRSCPPVAFYEAVQLDEQLDAAADAFINTEGVRDEHGEIVLSPLFEFYVEDFGGQDRVIAWLLRYLTDPDLRRRVAGGTLRSASYDWSLNRDPRDLDAGTRAADHHQQAK
ncbi:MAG: DUF547 domain-containing protein [Dehalococcoidia bacterium]